MCLRRFAVKPNPESCGLNLQKFSTAVCRFETQLYSDSEPLSRQIRMQLSLYVSALTAENLNV